MFTEDGIADIVRVFSERKVFLYHSAQFLDYQSYVQIGGIPSRLLLEKRCLPFTRFETDASDHQNKVWDKVFLNPLDFGEIFQKGRSGVPTVYGPICFVFKPEALLEADDVAICLRSAGCPNFQRDLECLRSIEEVQKIFQYEPNVPSPNRTWIKRTADLRSTFSLPYASNPEISLSVPGQYLSFQHLVKVVVDPYRIQGKYLKEFVEAWSKDKFFSPVFQHRSYSTTQFKIANRIVDLIIEHGILPLEEILQVENIDPELDDWVKNLCQNQNMDDQWRRYARYLLHGTLAQTYKSRKIKERLSNE